MMSSKWTKRERLILEHVLKMRRQPASGAGQLHKEDGVSEDLLVQLKSTEQQTIGIHRDDVLILLRHAQTTGKRPVFALDFVDGPLLLCVRLEDFIDVACSLLATDVCFIHQKEKKQEQEHGELDLTELL